MDPVGVSLVNLLQGLQALPKGELPVPDGQLLMAYLGQDLDGLLEALTPTGTRIRFDAGPVITAEGQLPFPEGTSLKVRVSPAQDGTGGVRLQTLEARPPAPPALLVPLFQGEAFGLLQRLLAADEGSGLLPLKELQAQFLASQEASPAKAPVAGSPTPAATPMLSETPQVIPSRTALAAALEALPLAVRVTLSRVLGLPPQASASELAVRLVAESPAGEAPVSTAVPAQGSTVLGTLAIPAEAAPALALTRGEVASRILTFLASHPDLPMELNDILIRMTRPPRERGTVAERASESTRRGEAKPAATSANPSPEIAEKRVKSGETPAERALMAMASLAPTSVTARDTPAASSLETWIREGLRALGDPRISPQEAPFHVLQAREQTAFFELPMPGLLGQAMQLWVEWEEDREAPGGPSDGPVRLLMGTHLSRLGETRVGFASTAGSLSVRIWTEHPEWLDAEDMRQELAETGQRVDVRVLPLDPGAPSLRSLVAGRGWEGLV